MERRLYFILPDVDISRQIEDDLLLARIHEEKMHFLGKRVLTTKTCLKQPHSRRQTQSTASRLDWLRERWQVLLLV